MYIVFQTWPRAAALRIKRRVSSEAPALLYSDTTTSINASASISPFDVQPLDCVQFNNRMQISLACDVTLSSGCRSLASGLQLVHQALGQDFVKLLRNQSSAYNPSARWLISYKESLALESWIFQNGTSSSMRCAIVETLVRHPTCVCIVYLLPSPRRLLKVPLYYPRFGGCEQNLYLPSRPPDQHTSSFISSLLFSTVIDLYTQSRLLFSSNFPATCTHS